MATQLANFHNGTCRIFKDKPFTLRKQHGHPKTPFRRNIRLFRRADDPDQNKESQESNVRRILGDIQALLRGARRSAKILTHQGDFRDLAQIPQLDSSWVHIRNENHRLTFDPRECEIYLLYM